MKSQDIVSELCLETDSRIVLLVLDGLGDLPQDGKTALEAAHTPNLDRLAAQGVCGMTDPISMGITPGSGPSHLALFGYDPIKYQLGRGILEALGVDVEVGEHDLVARANFATLQDGKIVDRRAGRIPTAENIQLCERINRELTPIEGAEVMVFPGMEHRFVVKFTKPGLRDELSDADPQKEGNPPCYSQALIPEAEGSAVVVNAFLDRVTSILSDQIRANTALMRGFARYPAIPTMQERFRLRPAAIANYPMYRGLSKLVGMEILPVGSELEDLFEVFEQRFQDFSFFYIHVKKTDSYGEDGNFEAKRDVIEQADAQIPRLLALKPEVISRHC